MTRNKIEKPKVFISYAWSSEEYQDFVMDFASKLMGDGIEAILDKWDLIEGNNINAYMERCVNDRTITNVLILIDPLYARKANERKGGVGTETQIISTKVYEKIDQCYFIPVIMKRDNKGKICKPTYLEGRLHFDLSVKQNYNSEYQRLVKTLYGIDIHKKPKLGKKPDWVDKSVDEFWNFLLEFDIGVLKNKQSAIEKNKIISRLLNEISNKLIKFTNKDGELKEEEYIIQYDKTEIVRNYFLQLLEYLSYAEDNCKYIINFFEETINNLKLSNDYADIVKIRVHELFIYVIAFYLQKKDYETVSYILSEQCFNEHKCIYGPCWDNYTMFFSGTEHFKLDNYIRTRDKRNYLTGKGQHWIETMATDYCSKEQFILADLICYNRLVYGNNKNYYQFWFPITYAYDDEFNSILKNFSIRLGSYNFANKILPVFGFKRINDFCEKIKSIEFGRKNMYEARFPNYHRAYLLTDFIKIDEIGKR